MDRLRFVQPEGVPRPGGPYSPVGIVGGLVFVCGQIPCDTEGKVVSEDFAAQAEQVFANLGRCLSSVGCQLSDVVKVNAFIATFDDFAAYNDVYQSVFRPPYPVRTTVEAGLAGIKLEVECTAVAPPNGLDFASDAGCRGNDAP